MQPPPRLSKPVLFATTAVLAACSILYELVLAQTLAALLGNTVLRYSITIGVYLGALGIGAMLGGKRETAAEVRLVRVELWLSFVGGLAVPLFFILDGLQRYLYLSLELGWAPVVFLIVTHLVIFAIGVMSGFEIPLLIAMGEEIEPGSTNKVLGVDYLGSLVGAVLFPLVLLPQLGLFASAFSVALLNAAAAAVIAFWQRVPQPHRPATYAASMGLVLAMAVARAGYIEQHFLQTYYYLDSDDPLGLFTPVEGYPQVEHVRSEYQSIDLVRDPDPTQWLTDLLLVDPLDGRKDLWLYLDGEFQMFSGTEPLYHEWFAHVPIHTVDAVPTRVLVLGGGDGMLVRELLKYGGLREVVHVEIDPEMLRLARHHPILSALNFPAFRDPRHRVVVDDAFTWLRDGQQRFDAIYIDMPYPKDHNLSLVYSREFYRLVASRLEPQGFVALDAPGADCHDPDGFWRIYYNTLREAGFVRVEQYETWLDEPAALRRALAKKRLRSLGIPRPERRLIRKRGVGYLDKQIDEQIEDISGQEFIIAYPWARPLDRSATELGVELKALRPELVAKAFSRGCPRVRDEDAVNSIVRPVLPPLDLVSLRNL